MKNIFSIWLMLFCQLAIAQITPPTGAKILTKSELNGTWTNTGGDGVAVLDTIYSVSGSFSDVATSTLDFRNAETFGYMDLTANVTIAATDADVGEWYYLKITGNNFDLDFSSDFQIIDGQFEPSQINYFEIHVCGYQEITVEIHNVAIPLVADWKDLRAGGDAFSTGTAAGNDIRFRTGMSVIRDATGMSFSGSNPWSSWVKFESLAWQRGQNKAVQWIMTAPNSAMMIGITSNATNETNTAQYAQSEINAYFTNANNLWGLYGNNGTVGAAASQNFTTSLPSAAAYKIVFTSDGDAGGTFALYSLPSAAPADWDDISTLIVEQTININPNEQTIMPGIIPSAGGTHRFIAVSVN